ncbi:PspC domain-containing protein, partial [uncultured Flavobacterium sp.]|uniref:PspC domain-containing protein n=1 Tax=uncultured Flavobacterium sp. TaxID=165435 RepID=UPI0030CA2801
MNKTISINLGGYFFHIDEDAYSKLTSYLDAVKRSLSPEGREEVVKDIESRIAELFQENIKNEKQVISIIEVEGMISIMGQPEDYKIDDEPLKKESKSYNTYYTSKKLYKDDNNKTLGGVCAGLGHYIGIDSIWIKIVFILLSFSGGFGIPLYIILWILLPKAISTTQKLEMRGMPINISNIEKKVKEGIDDITTKINDIDTDRIIHNVKNGSQKIGNTIEDVFLTLFKIIGKIIGTFIVIVSSISLIGLLLGTVFMFFSTTVSHVHMPWNEYLRAENYTDFPMWILYIFSFFVTAIPVFIFLILGLKLLVNDLKSIGSYAKYSLLALWLLSVLFFIYFGLRQASEVGFESKVIDKRELVISPNDTLKLNISFNDFYTKSINEKSDFVFTVDENEKEIIYSNNIKI